MAYAVQSDLVPLRLTWAELVQLTCDDPTETVNAAIVTAALEEASGMVDSYCRHRYQTPLQVSDDVKGKTLDIALWLLFRRRRNAKNGEIIRQGFNPPGRVSHAVLRTAMRVETALCRRPPLGSSLLMVAQTEG